MSQSVINYLLRLVKDTFASTNNKLCYYFNGIVWITFVIGLISAENQILWLCPKCPVFTHLEQVFANYVEYYPYNNFVENKDPNDVLLRDSKRIGMLYSIIDYEVGFVNIPHHANYNINIIGAASNSKEIATNYITEMVYSDIDKDPGIKILNDLNSTDITFTSVVKSEFARYLFKRYNGVFKVGAACPHDPLDREASSGGSLPP